MVNKRIPKIIKDVGFDFNWSENKAWALDYHIEEMPISELSWHFEIYLIIGIVFYLIKLFRTMKSIKLNMIAQ